MSAAVKPSLTIKRRFNAPPEKVFAAWADPEKMKHWMGPAGTQRIEAKCDLRVGGRYHIEPDGHGSQPGNPGPGYD